MSIQPGQQSINQLNNWQLLKASALSTRRLHLGCGANILQEWTNIDIEPKPGAFAWDLSRPLPLPDANIAFIYSEHFIEHIPFQAAVALLRECRRLLCAGGVLRLSTPDLAFMVDQYQKARIVEWLDLGWAPQTACAMVNEGMRAWGHQYVYDRAELDRVLRFAGFVDIVEAEWRRSAESALSNLESRPWHHELIIEARP